MNRAYITYTLPLLFAQARYGEDRCLLSGILLFQINVIIVSWTVQRGQTRYLLSYGELDLAQKRAVYQSPFLQMACLLLHGGAQEIKAVMTHKDGLLSATGVGLCQYLSH